MLRGPLPALALATLLGGSAGGCRFGFELLPRGNGDGDDAAPGGAGGELDAMGGLGGEPMGSGGTSAGAGGESLGGAPMGGAASGGAASGGAMGTGGAVIPFGEVAYCDRLHQLPSEPNVDGAVDFEMPLQEVTPVGFRTPADAMPPYDVLPSDVSMRYAAGFRPGGIYFFVEVTDPDYNPAPGMDPEWMGDGVELYLDHDGLFPTAGTYDSPGTYSFLIESSEDGIADGADAGYFTPFTRQGDWTGDYISRPISGGYVVEAYIQAADLGLGAWALGEGASLGFDLAHNISLPDGVTGSEGNRWGQYFLRISETPVGGDEDYPYYNSSVFCTPELVVVE